MTSKLIAIASALVATTALATAADAGGGVRLGFGGPLGTFVATPSHGGGSGASAYRKPAKRKAPVVHAARKPDKPDKPAAKKASRVAKADAPKEVQKHVAKKTVPAITEAEKAAPETTTEQTPSVSGSSALIQGSIPVEPSTGDTPEAPAAEVKAEAAPEKTEQADAVAAAADQPSDGAEDCKKFIPAVGMTVSVGCDE